MKVTVFVADDEPAIRSAIVKRLAKQHRVVGYESGDALLAALGHEVPDLILLDLKMPGLSGLETFKKLHAAAPQVLVIMMTAYGTVKDAVDAMKLGVYDFLIKTVEFDGMDPVVDRAVDLLNLRWRLDMEKENLDSQYGLSNPGRPQPGHAADPAPGSERHRQREIQRAPARRDGDGQRVSRTCAALQRSAGIRAFYRCQLHGHSQGAF